MHLTRAQTSRRLPIARKGTIYVARPLSHASRSITALAAVRDMLNLGHTAREVKGMINNKAIKINGKPIRDYREPVHIFNILEVGKKYRLSILPSGRFCLEETKDNKRIAKVIGKKILNGNVSQINMHDGTNLISKERVNIGDSVELDFSNKLIKIIPLGKGSKVFVEFGRSRGNVGVVQALEKNNIQVKLADHVANLNRRQLIAL